MLTPALKITIPFWRRRKGTSVGRGHGGMRHHVWMPPEPNACRLLQPRQWNPIRPWGISQGFLSARWARPANTEVDTRLDCPHKINKTEFLKEHTHAKNNTDDFWSLGQNCAPRMWPESYHTQMTTEALVRVRLGLCLSHRSWKGEQRDHVGRKARAASGGARRESRGHKGSLGEVQVHQKGVAILARLNPHLILELYMIATVFTQRCNLTRSTV